MSEEEAKENQPVDHPGWYLRALGIVAVVVLEIINFDHDPYVYALIVGFVLGIKPSTVSKVLSALAKILQEN